MSIVLFGGEKGGTGKTTLATNMAALLALQGKDVLLLDTDRQGTASFWATVRENTEIEPRIACVQKFGKGLASQVRDLAERYDEIVIDAGGRDSMELRYSLGVCDRAYIPVQPFQFDIWTIRQMDELVEMAQGLNENLQAFIVLNRVSTNPAVREEQETREFFEEEEFQHLALVDSVLRDRIAVRKSGRDGLSVIEWKQDKKAANEMNQLYKEVYCVATKKKTPLRSTPKMSKDKDLDKFAAGAGTKSTKADEVYPWEEPHVRDDVKKTLPLRIDEPLYLKLKFIAERTPYSMNSFILDRVIDEIEEEITRLTE